ncbi:chemotaxis protein CheX [Symbiobacterium thermophilum]|uniref:chemotaxis protein CheX n=1 Tax=Symbiobacterium thermophilum TaxID=2734 RepID=UPI0035C6D0FE
MKVEFLNPFVYAGLKVLASEAGLKSVVSDKPQMRKAIATLHAVNVVIGVMGSVQGLVVYGMELHMAKGIIRAMTGQDFPITDPMAESALGELANLVTGYASGTLEQAGWPSRISPPRIVRGTGVRFANSAINMLTVPIITELGQITIYLARGRFTPQPGRRAVRGPREG